MNHSPNQPVTQSPNLQSPNLPISPSPLPKAEWTPPALRVTPIAETAGSKATAIGDGTNAFSS